MCGINGFNFQDKSLEARMKKFTKSRGPDAFGSYNDEYFTILHDKYSQEHCITDVCAELSIEERPCACAYACAAPCEEAVSGGEPRHIHVHAPCEEAL